MPKKVTKKIFPKKNYHNPPLTATYEGNNFKKELKKE
jgi:hypothetical protein